MTFSVKPAFVALDSTGDRGSGQNAHSMFQALKEVNPAALACDRLRLSRQSATMVGATQLLRPPIGRRTPVFFAPAAIRHYGRAVDRFVSAQGVDRVIANQPLLVSDMTCSVTTVIHTDSTVSSLVHLGGYYDGWPDAVIGQMVEAERRAFNKASRIVVTSKWARASVLADYAQNPAKVDVMPIAANLRPHELASRASAP